MIVHVIKSNGKVELFSLDKLRSSIQKSLIAVHESQDEAKKSVDSIEQACIKWLTNKHEVTSKDIRVFITKRLALHNKDAALVYKKHKEMW